MRTPRTVRPPFHSLWHLQPPFPTPTTRRSSWSETADTRRASDKDRERGRWRGWGACAAGPAGVPRRDQSWPAVPEAKDFREGGRAAFSAGPLSLYLHLYLSPPLLSSRRRFTTRTGLGRACMTPHCHRVHFRGRLHRHRHRPRPIAVWRRNPCLSAARRRRSSRAHDKRRDLWVDRRANATTKTGTVLRFRGRRLSVDSSAIPQGARLIQIQGHSESNDAGQLPNLRG